MAEKCNNCRGRGRIEIVGPCYMDTTCPTCGGTGVEPEAPRVCIVCGKPRANDDYVACDPCARKESLETLNSAILDATHEQLVAAMGQAAFDEAASAGRSVVLRALIKLRGVEPEANAKPSDDERCRENCLNYERAMQDAADLRAAWEWWDGLIGCKETNMPLTYGEKWRALLRTGSSENPVIIGYGNDRVDAIVALWRKVVRK